MKQKFYVFLWFLFLYTIAFSINANANVVINEIMQNPSAVNDSAGEWFELYNPTDRNNFV